MLLAVITYHLATNKATGIFDIDTRRLTILKAQQEFEQSCSEIAVDLAVAGFHDQEKHYEYDHRGYWSEALTGNMAFPRVANPWAVWSATLPLPSAHLIMPEPRKPPCVEPQDTSDAALWKDKPGMLSVGQATPGSSHLPATSKSPPGRKAPWDICDEASQDEPHQTLAHPPSLGPGTVPRTRARGHREKGWHKGRPATHTGSGPRHTLYVDLPHPPICNRAGAEWGQPPRKCFCHLWQDWLKQAHPTKVKDIDTFVCEDDSLIVCNGEQQSFCAFWKPGRQKHYDFFNGVVHRILENHNHNAPAEYIVAVNTVFHLKSEGLHYVGRLDVSGPPFDRHNLDLSQAQLYQKWMASQDPNEQ